MIDSKENYKCDLQVKGFRSTLIGHLNSENPLNSPLSNCMGFAPKTIVIVVEISELLSD